MTTTVLASLDANGWSFGIAVCALVAVLYIFRRPTKLSTKFGTIEPAMMDRLDSIKASVENLDKAVNQTPGDPLKKQVADTKDDVGHTKDAVEHLRHRMLTIETNQAAAAEHGAETRRLVRTALDELRKLSGLVAELAVGQRSGS